MSVSLFAEALPKGHTVPSVFADPEKVILTNGLEDFSVSIVNHTASNISVLYAYAECDCSFLLPEYFQIPSASATNLVIRPGPEASFAYEKITFVTDYPPSRYLMVEIYRTNE